VLSAERLSRYRAIVLPSGSVLSDAEAQALRGFVAAGGGLVVDHLCGLFGPDGPRVQPALDDLLGIRRAGEPFAAAGDVSRDVQAYMRITGRHPALRSLGDLSLLPLPGRLTPVIADPGTEVPLRRAAPFRVFPEGWAYPEMDDPGEPILVARETGPGRTAYLATPLGRSFLMLHYPPLGDLIADTVRWAAGDVLPLQVQAPATLQVSLRDCPLGLAVHCVNMTGGERYMREIIPLRGVRLSVPEPAESRYARAILVSSGECLPLERREGWLSVNVPELGAYDVVLFEGPMEG